MPIVVTAAFHQAEGQTAELIDALRRSIPAVHDEQGSALRHPRRRRRRRRRR
jgi:hypothetical protein